MRNIVGKIFTCTHVLISLISFMIVQNSIRILGNTFIVTDSLAYLKCIHGWCTASSLFPYHLQYLTHSENLISSWSITLKGTVVVPSDLFYRGSYPWEKNVGYNIVQSWQQWYASIITTSLDSFHCWGNCSLFQVGLISFQASDFNVSPLCWNSVNIWYCTPLRN